MTITRDHVSDLAEKASSESEDPRSGKTFPVSVVSAAAADATDEQVGEAHTHGEVARDANAGRGRDEEGPAVVTLATLKSLPTNQEVTLYLDVVPAPPSKRPTTSRSSSKNDGQKAAHVSEFEKFLKQPCPDLGVLLRTLEGKMASKGHTVARRRATAAVEEVVATVSSQCVIVRKISRGSDNSNCTDKTDPVYTGEKKQVNFPNPSMPPPPPVRPRISDRMKKSSGSKVDATIAECLLGEFRHLNIPPLHQLPHIAYLPKIEGHANNATYSQSCTCNKSFSASISSKELSKS